MKATKDLLSGVFFTLFGVGEILIASRYSLGTAGEMGPAFFPIMIGGIVILTGAATMLKALMTSETAETINRWDLRPLGIALGSVVAFALMLESLGLVVSIISSVLLSRLARREGPVWEPFVLALFICIACIGVFVYGLKIPFKVWPL